MANKTLYMFNYNNYYNRQLKRFEAVAEYLDFVDNDYYTVNTLNFIPGDEINTSQILNVTDGLDYNYLLVVDSDDINSFSRWFIITSTRTRNGQYQLQLRRDIVSDYYEDVKMSPFMIEKGYVEDTNPLIFNDEGQIYNKIKKAEILLKDETQSAWVVGYIPRDAYEDGATIDMKIPLEGEYDIVTEDIQSDSNLYWNYKNTNLTTDDKWSADSTIQFYVKAGIFSSNQYITMNTSSGIYTYTSTGSTTNYPVEIDPNTSNITNLDLMISDYIYKAALNVDLNDAIKGYTDISSEAKTMTEYVYNNILALNNKIILDNATGNYYKAVITTETFNISNPSRSSSLSGAKYGLNQMKNQSTISSIENISDMLETNVNVNVTGTRIVLSYMNVTSLTSVDIPAKDSRMIAIDAPYDIFAVPYSNTLNIKLSDGSILNPNQSAATFIANAFTISNESESEAGSSYLYDIQILPYCPVRRYISGTNEIDISAATKADISDIYVTDSSGNKTTISKLFWCSSSELSFDIELPIEVDNYKESSSLDSYRLCSPNYDGLFDFNVAKNYGVDFFNVDITLKPFMPYIHVNPNFKGLYGNDYNDARGLILSGDFSLSIMTSAWTEYELQNKNYQLSFDRSIETMELTKNISLATDLVGGGLNALSTGITGGAVGGVGAGVGAGVASGIGGLVDAGLSNWLANDAIDAAKTQFNYQLGNIQALPQSISKVTALNANNKLFPFLEYYTCTDVEREIFRNKIKYTGMTVMSTGYIIDYVNPDEETFVQATLIRLISDKANYRIASAISEEFRKGLYIERNEE